MQQYRLSRNTVRLAIARLRLEGLVETRPPWGTLVVTAGPKVPLRLGDRMSSDTATTVLRGSGRDARGAMTAR
jgi:DNA-binding FadR family transcriptional regulator